MEWLQENLGTMAVLLALIAIVASIIKNLIKAKKTGKPSCGCGCSECSLNDDCKSR